MPTTELGKAAFECGGESQWVGFLNSETGMIFVTAHRLVVGGRVWNEFHEIRNVNERVDMTKKLFVAFALLGLSVAVADADTLFDLANTDDATFEHDTDGTNSPSPIPSAGSQNVGNGTFEWGSLASDTSPNTAEFASGTFAASDWGGDGTFTSDPIDVTNFDEVDIDAVFDGEFNSGSEFSNFFYTLDAGSPVSFGAGVEDTTHTDEAVGVADLDVSAASSMTVGFEFNHNGASDFFNVDSFTVTGQPVPEPSTYALMALAALGLGYFVRRRRG